MTDQTPGAANPLRSPAIIALFAITAGVFLWIALVTAPAFERAAGVPLPDGRIFGYLPSDVAALHAAVKSNPEAAVIANHLYRTLEFILPALVALSITLLAASGFAALIRLGSNLSVPLTRIISGAISIPYLVIDLRENGLAQALFSAQSLAGDVPVGIARMLPAFTAWKFATLGAAVLVVIAIWFQVALRARRQAGK